MFNRRTLKTSQNSRDSVRAPQPESTPDSGITAGEFAAPARTPSHLLKPANITHLQHIAGNRAVVQMVRGAKQEQKIQRTINAEKDDQGNIWFFHVETNQKLGYLTVLEFQQMSPQDKNDFEVKWEKIAWDRHNQQFPPQTNTGSFPPQSYSSSNFQSNTNSFPQQPKPSGFPSPNYGSSNFPQPNTNSFPQQTKSSGFPPPSYGGSGFQQPNTNPFPQQPKSSGFPPPSYGNSNFQQPNTNQFPQQTKSSGFPPPSYGNSNFQQPNTNQFPQQTKSSGFPTPNYGGSNFQQPNTNQFSQQTNTGGFSPPNYSNSNFQQPNTNSLNDDFDWDNFGSFTDDMFDNVMLLDDDYSDGTDFFSQIEMLTGQNPFTQPNSSPFSNTGFNTSPSNNTPSFNTQVSISNFSSLPQQNLTTTVSNTTKSNIDLEKYSFEFTLKGDKYKVTLGEDPQDMLKTDGQDVLNHYITAINKIIEKEGDAYKLKNKVNKKIIEALKNHYDTVLSPLAPTKSGKKGSNKASASNADRAFKTEWGGTTNQFYDKLQGLLQKARSGDVPSQQKLQKLLEDINKKGSNPNAKHNRAFIHERVRVTSWQSSGAKFGSGLDELFQTAETDEWIKRSMNTQKNVRATSLYKKKEFDWMDAQRYMRVKTETVMWIAPSNEMHGHTGALRQPDQSDGKLRYFVEWQSDFHNLRNNSEYKSSTPRNAIIRGLAQHIDSTVNKMEWEDSKTQHQGRTVGNQDLTDTTERSEAWKILSKERDKLKFTLEEFIKNSSEVQDTTTYPTPSSPYNQHDYEPPSPMYNPNFTLDTNDMETIGQNMQKTDW